MHVGSVYDWREMGGDEYEIGKRINHMMGIPIFICDRIRWWIIFLFCLILDV